MLKNDPFSSVHLIKAKRLGSSIVPYLKSVQSVLDVGCGNMQIARYIRHIYPEKKIIGVDIRDYRTADLPIVLYDGKKLPFKNKQFDCAYAVFVLHHTDNPREMLREIIRVAKKIVIIEEVYSSKFQKILTFLHDWVFNKLESVHMEVPGNFLTDREWKSTFDSFGMILKDERDVWQMPRPFNLTHQKLYAISHGRK